MSDQPTKDPYSQGVDRLRDTAKWIITIFAGLGALLFGGTQLSSIGSLGSLQADHRLLLALLTGAVTLAAIGYIIWKATDVLTLTGGVSLDELLRMEKFEPSSAEVKYIKDEQGLLGRFNSLEELDAELKEVIEKRTPLLESPSAENKAERERYNRELTYIGAVLSQVRSGARYYRVRSNFIRLRVQICIAASLAALTSITFIWAVNPPAPAPAKAAAFHTPVSADLTLTEAGRALLADSLGEGCVSSQNIPVVVLGVEGAVYDVVSLPSENCRVSRFTVAGEVGLVKRSSPVAIPAQ